MPHRVNEGFETWRQFTVELGPKQSARRVAAARCVGGCKERVEAVTDQTQLMDDHVGDEGKDGEEEGSW